MKVNSYPSKVLHLLLNKRADFKYYSAFQDNADRVYDLYFGKPNINALKHRKIGDGKLIQLYKHLDIVIEEPPISVGFSINTQEFQLARDWTPKSFE